MTDIRELLPLYAIGAADADERRAVEAAIATDPGLARELASHQDVASALAVATAAPAPASYVKARLLASVGVGRFERFTTRFASLFDVSVDRARELLGWTEDPTKWAIGLPGLQVIHFAGGPQCHGADTGFLEVQPGARFPWHEHVGEEVMLVLAGALRDHDGTVYAAGDELAKAPATQHDFSAASHEPVVLAVRAFGVRYGLVKPNDG
jgi:hypothetical protein